MPVEEIDKVPGTHARFAHANISVKLSLSATTCIKIIVKPYIKDFFIPSSLSIHLLSQIKHLMLLNKPSAALLLKKKSMVNYSPLT